jgi:hypothetical protein
MKLPIKIDIKDGFLHSSHEIVEELKSHITPITNFQRRVDSGIRNFEQFHWNKERTNKELKRFDRNFGEFLDGSQKRFPSNETYVKVSSNLSMARVDGNKVLKNEYLYDIIKMTTLAKEEFGALQLYVNEHKIPDDLIYIYMSESQTDILFPKRFLNTETSENDFFIEKRIYPKFQYINVYFPIVSGSFFQFDISKHEFEHSNINEHNLLIFQDGQLLMSEKYVNSTWNEDMMTRRVTITIQTVLTENEIEIMFDSSIKSKTVFAHNQPSTQASWFIKEMPGYYDILNGPIAKTSGYFFVNGRRIPNNKINQVGRVNFTYDDTINNIKTCTCYFSDRDLELNDTKFTVYDQDYYLINMIGPENITKALRGLYTNNYFQGLNFHKILNNNSKTYNINEVTNYIKNIEKYTDADSKTKYLLKDNPSLMREFLKFFGKADMYKNIRHTDEEFHTLSFDVDYGETNQYEYIYLIEVEGKHVKDTHITVENKGIREYVKVPGNYFKSGINRLHIQMLRKMKVTTIDYKIFAVADIQNVNGTNMITLPALPTAQDASDYLILEYSQNETNYIYDTTLDSGNPNQGWKMKKDVHIQLNNDKTVSIIFDTLPKKECALYSKRFCFKYTKVIERNVVDLEDVAIPLRSNSTYKVPIIPNGLLKVYLNNNLLYEGIDYYIRHPENFAFTTYTIICVKRNIKKDDVLTVYFTDIKNKVVQHKAGKVFNKYGFVYFGSIDFPYSPDYIDLYINGRLIYKDEIEILSDKLIRVPNEVEPFIDVYAETNFRVDIDKFNFFLEDYEDSYFEKFIRDIFIIYDLNTSSVPTPANGATDFYYSLDENVDSVMKLPNPSDNSRNEYVRYDLLTNAYLIWLRSVSSKSLMKPSEDIKEEIVNYFQLYSDSLTKRNDIVISSKGTSLYENLIFGPYTYPFNKAVKNRRLIQWAMKNKIPSGEILEKYKFDLNEANDIYPRDVPKSVSSRSVVDTIKYIGLGGRDQQ